MAVPGNDVFVPSSQCCDHRGLMTRHQAQHTIDAKDIEQMVLSIRSYSTTNSLRDAQEGEYLETSRGIIRFEHSSSVGVYF
jgi:hypothetical protein